MPIEDKIKAFGMTNMLIESDLDKIENKFEIELREQSDVSEQVKDIESIYVPQFEDGLRKEARYMARNYELFYCLEKTIRNQISELLDI
jgi:hypothetical protein